MNINFLKQATGVILILVVLVAGCRQQEAPALRIALSKGIPDSSYANYYRWIDFYDSTAICTDMYGMPLDSALMLFEGCSGLILTGGTDADPALYGKPGEVGRCWPVDPKRDSLEIALFNAAVQAGKPILGICRGEQMINVACGGSLIVDIPTDFDTVVEHQCDDYLKCFHSVTVESGTLLHSVTGVYVGEVTTNHHQGVDRIGKDLRAASHASDGLIEAVEWSDTAGKAFMLGVQWHPERMAPENPLSEKIALKFLDENRKYMTKRKEAVK